MFQDTVISSEDGKSAPWDGLMDTILQLSEQKYLVHDRSRTLKFIIDKRSYFIGDKESSIFFITNTKAEEQTYARITENRYSQLLISTITHELKSPISAIINNLELLGLYTNKEGMNHLMAAQISAKAFGNLILSRFLDTFITLATATSGTAGNSMGFKIGSVNSKLNVSRSNNSLLAILRAFA